MVGERASYLILVMNLPNSLTNFLFYSPFLFFANFEENSSSSEKGGIGMPPRSNIRFLPHSGIPLGGEATTIKTRSSKPEFVIPCFT